jgi:hypothetical protein
MAFQRNQLAYAQSVGITPTNANLIFDRDPNANDVNYTIGQFWQNTSNESLWYLNSFTSTNAILQADWINIESSIATLSDTADTPVSASSGSSIPPNNIQLINLDGSITILSDPPANRIIFGLAGGAQAVDSFQPDTGTNPVVPDAAGLVKILGQSTPNVSGIRVTGTLNELDIAMFSPFAGSFAFSTALAGSQLSVGANNTSNTALSSSLVYSVVGGTSAGNAIFQAASVGGVAWSWGLNTSDQTFRLNPSSSIGTGDVFNITPAGITTFTLNDVAIQRSRIGSSVIEIISNTDNTNPNSGAALIIQTGGSSGGDSAVIFGYSASNGWVIGQDISASESFVLSRGNALGTTNKFAVSTAGAITFNNVYTFPTVDGSAGQSLITNGAGQLSFGSGSSVSAFTSVTTTPYVVLSSDGFLSVDTSTAKTIQLPNTTTTGRVIIVKDATGNAAANNITVTTVGGIVNIDGATTYPISINYGSASFIWSGTAYEVF